MKKHNIHYAKNIIHNNHNYVSMYDFSRHPIFYGNGNMTYRNGMSSGYVAEILYAYIHGEYYPEKITENELLSDISKYLGTRSYNLFRIEKWPAKKREKYVKASDTKKKADVICEMIDYYTNWHKDLEDIPENISHYEKNFNL